MVDLTSLNALLFAQTKTNCYFLGDDIDTSAFKPLFKHCNPTDLVKGTSVILKNLSLLFEFLDLLSALPCLLVLNSLFSLREVLSIQHLFFLVCSIQISNLSRLDLLQI